MILKISGLGLISAIPMFSDHAFIQIKPVELHWYKYYLNSESDLLTWMKLFSTHVISLTPTELTKLAPPRKRAENEISQ